MYVKFFNVTKHKIINHVLGHMAKLWSSTYEGTFSTATKEIENRDIQSTQNFFLIPNIQTLFAGSALVVIK